MATLTLDQALATAEAWRGAGQTAAAENLLRQVLQQQPAFPDGWHRLGLLMLMSGRFAEARDALRTAVGLAPQRPEFHADLGVAAWQLRLADEAKHELRTALTLQPHWWQALRNLGDVLASTGEWAEAETCYRQAHALHPTEPGTLNNIGNVLAQRGDWIGAADFYGRAVAAAPQLFEAQCNLGDALKRIGRLAEAVQHSQCACALRPELPNPWVNLSNVYRQLLDHENVLRCCHEALARDPRFPDAHVALAARYLLTGDFARGWPEFEWRWQLPGYAVWMQKQTAPRWNGAALTGGTLLIHSEQGFGDTLQFLRYLPLAVARAAARRVIFTCPPALRGLVVRSVDLAVEVVAATNADPVPPSDAQCPLLSLPLALGIHEPVPMNAPYLHPDAERVAAWKRRLSADHRNVGIAWAGNPEHLDDRWRSLPAERIAPLLRAEGCRFLSLQIEPRGPLPPLLAEAGLPSVATELSDFDDTAALVAALDLIITADTALAHLAGALGRPVWLLVPFAPDWRWGLGRDDSPWYPSMRLLRQPRHGDWPSVIARAAAELAALGPVTRG